MKSEFNLTKKQIAILQRLADHADATSHIDPAEDANCLYLTRKAATPLCELLLIAQLEVDGEPRPFYCLLPWGWDVLGRVPKHPEGKQTLRASHLSARDKHNIRVLHLEFGISYNVLSTFYHLKRGSIGWLVRKTNY